MLDGCSDTGAHELICTEFSKHINLFLQEMRSSRCHFYLAGFLL